MTIAEMRQLLGLGDEVSDAAVVEAYAASLQTPGEDPLPFPLAEMKLHLRVERTDEDELISTLMVASRRHCEHQTDRLFKDLIGPDVAPWVVAMKMLVAHWYANREAVAVGQSAPAKMPLAVEALLAPYRIFLL